VECHEGEGMLQGFRCPALGHASSDCETVGQRPCVGAKRSWQGDADEDCVGADDANVLVQAAPLRSSGAELPIDSSSAGEMQAEGREAGAGAVLSEACLGNASDDVQSPDLGEYMHKQEDGNQCDAGMRRHSGRKRTRSLRLDAPKSARMVSLTFANAEEDGKEAAREGEIRDETAQEAGCDSLSARGSMSSSGARSDEARLADKADLVPCVPLDDDGKPLWRHDEMQASQLAAACVLSQGAVGAVRATATVIDSTAQQAPFSHSCALDSRGTRLGTSPQTLGHGVEHAQHEGHALAYPVGVPWVECEKGFRPRVGDTVEAHHKVDVETPSTPSLRC
jgi:hypothetical protein